MDLKLGLDAKRAAQNRTGLGNYSRFVLQLLASHAPQVEQHLFVPNPDKDDALPCLPSNRASTHSPRTRMGRRWGWLWRSFGIAKAAKREQLALYHGLSNELPFGIRRACRSVVTVHDLIFLHRPQNYPVVDRLIYRLKLRYAVRTADRIVAISEFTKRDLVNRLHVDEHKIDVVYQGQQLRFDHILPEAKEAVRMRYQLPSRFALSVGTIEERKNLLLVVEALHVMQTRGTLPESFRVVVVGRRTRYADQLEKRIAQYHLQSHFQLLHEVPSADLPAFYLLAELFVYPSRLEGFGIPMLEAAAAGVPAVGCTGSSLEEAGGPSAFYVSPDDAQGMAEVLLTLWNDEALRQRCRLEGINWARRFDDRSLCDALLQTYRRALSDSEAPKP